jgi:hypothetical protein
VDLARRQPPEQIPSTDQLVGADARIGGRARVEQCAQAATARPLEAFGSFGMRVT